MVWIASPLSVTQLEADSATCLSLSSQSYLRGWMTLGVMASPAILAAGAVTFLVLH